MFDPNTQPLRKRLLFVDDEGPMRAAFVRLMARQGYEVEVAASADEALALARFGSYPVVVADVLLPGPSGFELVERLRALQPATRFVLVTGLARSEFANVKALAYVEAVLEKPWDHAQLLEIIDDAFAAGAARRSSPPSGAAAGMKADVQVLLVENDQTDAQLVSLALQRPGLSHRFQVHHVRSLLGAVGKLQEHHYDVVLMSLHLPDRQGVDAVRYFLGQAPLLPIIVLSGHDDYQLATAVVQSGAQDFLEKSQLDSEGVSRAIRYAIERKQIEKRMLRMAQFDSLTGLPNYAFFRQQLAETLARARQSQDPFSVLRVGVDRFKAINDGLGRDAGDVFLRHMAERLRGLMREGDLLARAGGDEFVVGLSPPTSAEETNQIANNLRTELSRPEVISDLELVNTASIGIAHFPASGRTVDDLLEGADAAMHAAKESGAESIKLLGQHSRRGVLRRLQMEMSLRRALNRKEFELHYQPQYRTQDRVMQGMEALLRWRSKDRLVPAGEFIPLLEETGLVIDVGAWVIEEACEQLQRWRAKGANLSHLAVNVSSLQFEHGDVVREITGALEAADLPADALEVELTESTLMRDTKRAQQALQDLRALGVRIAIDDFGTGYSSLAYLHRFPVHVLKVDRSFVSELGTGTEAEAIVRSIITLGKTLRLDIVAEGVENEQQMAFVRQEGCHAVQGYYLARPQPSTVWDNWSGEPKEGQ